MRASKRGRVESEFWVTCDKETHESYWYVFFPGVWRRGSNSTRPGRDHPRLCRRSNRPAGVFFSRSHKGAWSGAARSEKPRTAADTQPIFFLEQRPHVFTSTACACTHARRSISVCPSPARSSPPAFHFACRVVWCRGQSHGRWVSRIAVSSCARDSGAAPCPSSRPTMPPVLALLSSPS